MSCTPNGGLLFGWRLFMLKEYFGEEKYEEIKNSDNLIYKALEIVSNIFNA